MKTVITILIILISSKVFSQEITFENAEEILSQYYEKNQWNEIIYFGNKALNNGIDFYSLRFYLGVAYFKKEEYFDAIGNLEKADELSTGSPTILKYLYYSFLYTGRFEESNNVFFKLPDSEKKKIRPMRNSFINDAAIETGEGFSNDESKNGGINFLTGDNVYGEQIISKNTFYFNAGFNQIPYKLFSLAYGYTYLNRSKELIIQNEISNYKQEYSQIQNQFYNSLGIVAGEGLVITPAAQYIGVKSPEYNSQFDSVTYVYNSSSMNYDSVKYYYTLTGEETNAADFVLSMTVSKFISRYKFSLNGSFSYLNNTHQTQIGAAFQSYPFGKINFFTNTVGVVHFQNSISEFIFSQYLGGSFGKKFQVSGYATIGKIYNYNEQNGFLVYNDIDIINNKFGAQISYYFSNFIRVNLFYEFQNREKQNNTIEFNGVQNNEPVFTQKFENLNYSVNAVGAGLKIIF